MAKAKNGSERPAYAAALRREELPQAIDSLKKRRDEALNMHPRDQTDISTMATTIATKVSQTFVDIYQALSRRTTAE